MYDPETPLLSGELKAATIYDRYTRAQKRAIIGIIAWAGLIPYFLLGSLIPAIPQIANEMQATPAAVSLSISFSTIASALGSLFWGSYSSHYGRRPIYLASVPCVILGSLGSGLAADLPQLFFWRFVQAFGAGSALSVGTAVVGDIYTTEERGTAMGMFLAVQLIGPAVAPMGGGAAAHYASWRHMQFILCFASIVTLILSSILLPETSHPGTRGMDQPSASKRRFVFINPLRSLYLLRSPAMMLVCVVASLTLLSDFVLWVPLPYTVGERYGITNEILVGACFLPCGLGNLIGAPIAGRVSDRIMITLRLKRGGKSVPEDRIRGTEFGSFFLVPASLLLAGVASQYIDGPFGIILNLVALFMNGLGAVFVLAPLSAYVVDILQENSAEAAAATNGMRTFLCALMTAGIMPCLDRFGVMWTNVLAAVLAWVAYALLLCIIRYGDALRGSVDVGFSKEEHE
ncbi:MFS general substrate transporter [Hygrophoropsis aurantiaca]|uniref:MFS general substrate transporter n=1 Tax=Hygrophoropsis aurantiaca TaxID=72124 RepID=A0ACB8AKE5_9AGAM|nr:MFS general substrate transporter [Hygrophoropsis aurantiaca]